MALLRDEELLSEVVEKGMVTPVRDTRNWDDKDSPIQPTSLDLHVGKIHLPEKLSSRPGGKDKPLSSHILRPGETVIVITAEELNLGGDISAFGFPPSRVAFKGILVCGNKHGTGGSLPPNRRCNFHGALY